jgi:hypothetical protein
MGIRDSDIPNPPALIEERIQALIRTYSAAQTKLERLLARASVTEFQNFRYGEQLKQIKAIVAALNVEAEEVARGIMPAAYQYGANLSADALEKSGMDIERVSWGNKIHTEAVNAVTDQMTVDLLRANQDLGHIANRILRLSQQTAIEDAQMSKVVAEGIATGATRKEVSTSIQSDLEEALGKGVRVKAGKATFEPRYYAELVARTRTREAVTEGSIRFQLQYGVDLVQISEHPNACEYCQEFQGQIFSISGTSEQYPKLEARPPYHPHCLHVCLGYVETKMPSFARSAEKAVSEAA